MDTAPSDRAPGRIGALVVIAVILIGAALRLIGLGAQSYWYDEAFSWEQSVKPIGEMIPALVRDFVHPPLHYLVLHGWFGVFGDSALSGRVIVALFGIGWLPLTWWLGRELLDRRTALFALALVAVSELGIAYSQEVRPYSQMVFLTLAATAFYARAIRLKSLWAMLGAAVCAALAMLTHYYSAFPFVAIVAWHLIFARSRLPIWWIGLAALVVIAAFSPWLFSGVIAQALSDQKSIQASLPTWFDVGWITPFENLAAFADARDESVVAPAWSVWRDVLGVALFCGPILPLVRGVFAKILPWRIGRETVLLAAVAGVGFASGGGKWGLIATTLTLMLIAAGRAPARWRRPGLFGVVAVSLAAAVFGAMKGAPPTFSVFLGLAVSAPLAAWMSEAEESDAWTRDLLLIGLVAAPILILIAAGRLGVQYDVRYVLSALPPFYLLAARGMARIRPPRLRIAWLAATITFSALGVYTALVIPSKENYRDAMAVVRAGYRPGDCAAFVTQGEVPVQWRLYGYDDIALRLIQDPSQGGDATHCGSVWLLLYQRVPSAAEKGEAAQRAMASLRPLALERQFHWVKVVKFGPAKTAQ